MGALAEENDPFLPDNARKRREEIEAAHRKAFPRQYGSLSVRVAIRQRWWLPWYARALRVCHRVTGWRPDLAKVEATIRKGLRTDVTPVTASLDRDGI